MMLTGTETAFASAAFGAALSAILNPVLTPLLTRGNPTRGTIKKNLREYTISQKLSTNCKACD
jgi:hypothetical protein